MLDSHLKNTPNEHFDIKCNNIKSAILKLKVTLIHHVHVHSIEQEPIGITIFLELIIN